MPKTPTVLTTKEAIDRAVNYNRNRDIIPRHLALKIQQAVGTKADGDLGPISAQYIASFQAEHGIEVTGMCMPETLKAILEESSATDEEVAAIATKTAKPLVLSADKVSKARQHFSTLNLPISTVRRVQRMVQTTQDGKWGSASIQALAKWQGANLIPPDGCLNGQTMRALQQSSDWADDPITVLPVDDYENQCDFLGFTAVFEAARGDLATVYGTCNRNGEYEGLFDQPKKDSTGRKLVPSERAKQPNSKPFWASKYHVTGGRHIGLSYGIGQGTQDGGTLAEICLAMWAADPALFYATFRGEAIAKEMLRVLTRDNAPVIDKRNPRVQKVAGADLWEDVWVRCFKQAATHEVFRKAQRDVFLSQYFVRMVPLALEHGFDSQGALAVYFDCAIQMGVGGASKTLTSIVKLLPPVAPGESRPVEQIEAVVNSLPEHHRKRRQNLLKLTSPWVRYAKDSFARVRPWISDARLRELARSLR